MSEPRAYADGIPGFWTLTRHGYHLYVTSVIDDQGTDVPDPYQLQVLVKGEWVTLPRDSRLVGSGPSGGLVTVMTFPAPGHDVEEYRLVP